MNEYSPLETFQKAYRLWWVVALCVFLGGSLGWVFHRFQPAVYEARATIVAQIDFTQTGELTELEQDQSIGAVLALFISTPVLQDVLDEARAEGLPLAGIAFGQNFFLERRRSNLELKVRDRDPQVAARLVNLWADNAYQALEEAHRHALRAQEIRQRLYPYAGCPTPTPGDEGAESCPTPAPLFDPQEVSALEMELNNELAASNAIHPAMLFDLSQRATTPAAPVALRLASLILGGALVGFLCGVIIANLSLPRGPLFLHGKRASGDSG